MITCNDEQEISKIPVGIYLSFNPCHVWAKGLKGSHGGPSFMSQGIRLYRLCQFILWNRKEKESYSIDTYAMESVDIIRGVNVDLRQYEYQEGRSPTLTKRAIHTLCSSWETGKVWSLSNWVPPNVTTSFRFVRRSIRALSLCLQDGLVPRGVRRHNWLTFQGENLIELITMSNYLG